jgi:hypothetical protein
MPLTGTLQRSRCAPRRRRHTGRFRAIETALSRVSGGKATESQRLFRTRQETGFAQEGVVELVGMRYAFYFNALDWQPAPFRPIERKRELDRAANWIPPMDLRPLPDTEFRRFRRAAVKMNVC